LKSWCSVALLCGAGAGEGGPMLTVQNACSWTTSGLDEFLEDQELRKIAKSLYKNDFKEFCDDMKEEFKGMSAEKKFQSFIEESLRDNEQEVFLEIMEAFAKKKKVKAAFCDAFMISGNDYWTLYITKVLPLNKEDIQELVEVYLEETNGCAELAEVVTHKLLGE